MKKIFIASLVFGFLVFWGFVQTGYCQQAQDLVTLLNPGDLKNRFIQNLVQSVSYQAADMAFDYHLRPVIRVLVADFTSPAGQEIVLGNEIASGLRATLHKGKQFHVYGREHPVSQSLKMALAKDPQWRPASQRIFKKTLAQEFASYPVELVIIGHVSKTTGTGDQLKIEVSLIPFYKPITMVESETGRNDILKQQFVSPILPSQEITGFLTVIQTPIIPKGRVIIVSLTNPDRGRDQGIGSRPSRSPSAPKDSVVLPEAKKKKSSLGEIACWLDDKECSTIMDWQDSKKKEYPNILSGLGADTIWFDEWVPEGPHSFFLSLVQVQDSFKNQYKTFSSSFFIKGGTVNYLFFSLPKDSLGDPKLQIQQVVDSKSRSWAF